MIQYSTDTERRNALQHNTIRYTKVRQHKIRRDTMHAYIQRIIIHYSTVLQFRCAIQRFSVIEIKKKCMIWYSTSQNNTMQYCTIQYDILWYNKTKYNTTQYMHTYIECNTMH